ncbi:nuclease-related domain-containing protein [Bacillus sp. V59.32b]|uniref:nuclease-related domain-containing protein n=1 Tax=Bacillus sp. V59.32b TaxID=1758642 RepID=UPI0020B13EB1|nr:nuclease-related domain-containing protein [Bacillus sp. V59.32b]
MLRRLLQNHPKRIAVKEDLSKRKVGFQGEENVDFHLKFLAPNYYSIFHDLRLQNGQGHFQIDTLLLSRKFALIIEVKNLYGTLFFDKHFNQMIRIANNKEEGFPNPVMQVARQKMQLQKWMAEQHLPTIPIEYLVAINDSRTLIKTDNENSDILEVVCHADHLINRIATIQEKITKEKYKPNEVRTLTNLLIAKHKPRSEDIKQLYGIHKTELITGVQCPICKISAMERKSGKWYCKACQAKSKDAHYQAIEDYFLLINPTITNPQLRWFLNISSKYVASKLLSTLNLPFTGEGKGRVYFQAPLK